MLKNKPSMLVLIGCGRHAKRNSLPILSEHISPRLKLLIIDSVDEIDNIRQYVSSAFPAIIDNVVFKGIKTSKQAKNAERLDEGSRQILDSLLIDTDIAGVIISTDPEFHLSYATWSIGHGLHTLFDKPLSAPSGLRSSRRSIRKIHTDYLLLKKLLLTKRNSNPNIACSVLSQRRYHTGFDYVRSAIQEVRDRYGVGVTSFQSFHSDGQWRPPLEIIDQDYHPYNDGYGKCLHSGYHSIDIVNLIVSENLNKKPKKIGVSSSFVYPDDYLAAFSADDQYAALGKVLSRAEKTLIDNELVSINSKDYGEISAHLNVGYSDVETNKKLSAGTISITHDGTAQRNWASAIDRDLYKGNGRMRQESYTFVCGPLMTIHIQSFETEDEDGIHQQDTFGEFDVHVIRNRLYFPDKPIEEVVTKDSFDVLSAGVDLMKTSRDAGLLDFIDCFKNNKISEKSDLLDHERTSEILTLVYESAFTGRFASKKS